MNQFITKAQVPIDQPTLYVQRRYDKQFDDYLVRNDYITVIGPRCSGKTSLLARKFHDLQGRQRYLPVYVNLSLLSKLDDKAWYERLHRSILDNTIASKDMPLATYELELRDGLLDLLEGELKSNILVVMLDDVETIPKPILTPLMAMIREVFSSREMVAAFKRCIFVLAGCFLPDDLILDPAISPFRIAERINLGDADLQGVKQLTDLLQTPQGNTPEWLAEQVFGWTDGDLYLTQRFCALLQQEPVLTKAIIDQIATQNLTQDDIFHRVLRYLQKNPRLPQVLTRIQTGSSPLRFTRLQRFIVEAWLAGLLKEDANGNCKIRNRVYETFLNQISLEAIEPVSVTMVLSQEAISGGSPTANHEKLTLHQRYTLEQAGGAGGMAKIFKATDMTNGETVAIKRLLRELATDPKASERFQREGEALQKLSHPNIVRFIEVFTEDNYQYIVMEYVHGGNLIDLIHREGRSLSIRTAVDIMIGVADGLAHAHEVGLVHRDIKPENILLTPNLTPRLADFGIARVISKSPLTEDGVLVGTITYLSPEACRGDTTGPQSDLWSVGVVLFEMLTGSVPFNGPNFAAIINAIENGPIPYIRDVRMDVPGPLAAIIMRLLSRDLSQRYLTAKDLAAALRMIKA